MTQCTVPTCVHTFEGICLSRSSLCSWNLLQPSDAATQLQRLWMSLLWVCMCSMMSTHCVLFIDIRHVQTSTTVRGHEEGVTLGGALQEVRKIIVVPTFLIIILQARLHLS